MFVNNWLQTVKTSVRHRYFSRKHRRRTKAVAVTAACESLEQRKMLTGVTGGLYSGRVLIQGTDQADAVETDFVGDYLRVIEKINGSWQTHQGLTGKVHRSQISYIEFQGFGGNDYYRNYSDKTAYAFGYDGNDTLIGGSGRDSLFGMGHSDYLVGLGGDDYIIGDGSISNLLHGNDSIYGGAGNDYMFGDGGDDYILGDDHISESLHGDDSIYGGAGRDYLLGQGGHDYIRGYGDNDSIYGGSGNDYLLGEDGDDYVRGYGGSDSLYGGAGRDYLLGESGSDYIRGDRDDDSLYGGPGVDSILGDDGNDYIRGGGHSDRLYGGLGHDYILGDAGHDFLMGDGYKANLAEELHGNDSLYGGTGVDSILGNGGDDYVRGGMGRDSLYGGRGNDYMLGDSGNDFLMGDEYETDLDRSLHGNDSLYGGSGHDSVQGQGGNDYLMGDDYRTELVGGRDTVTGGYGQDTLVGGGNQDDLRGGPGSDDLFGGAGNDLITEYLDTSPNRLWGGIGNDTLKGGERNDEIYGEAGSDQLYGFGGNDDIRGGSGYDESHGGTGDDLLTEYLDTSPNTLYGDGGNDTLEGGESRDSLYGGSGHDWLRGFASEDVLVGNSGKDSLDGGGGLDRLFYEEYRSQGFNELLAHRWAPILYQDVDDDGPNSLNGRSDYMSRVDFDGDWDARNNWENAEHYSLPANMYYSVVTTDSHWYVTYAVYHARDWSDQFFKRSWDQHENDMEGMLAIIKRDESGVENYGTMQAMVTTYHNDFVSYTVDGGPLTPAYDPDHGSFGNARDYGGIAPLMPVDGPDGVALHRPVIAQQAEGHGLLAFDIGGNHGLRPDGGDDTWVRYDPADVGLEPATPKNSENVFEPDRITPYGLVDIFEDGGLWDHRFDRLTFGRWGKFFGDNGANNAANAPWTWDDGHQSVLFGAISSDDDGRPAGEIAYDPANFADAWFDGETFSRNYTENQYREDDTAVFLVNGAGGVPWQAGADADELLVAQLLSEVNASEIHVAHWDNFYGHGTGGVLSGEGDFVEDMQNFLNIMEDSDTIVLVGYSYGGDSVLEIANATTRNIDLLVTIDPVGGLGFRSRLPEVVPGNVSYLLNRWQEVAAFPNENVLAPSSAVRVNHATNRLSRDINIADQTRVDGVDHTSILSDRNLLTDVWSAIDHVLP